MKKFWMITAVLVYSVALVAQKAKPIIVTTPNAAFLKNLEQAAKSLSVSPKNYKGLNANQVAFYNLIKSASTAGAWGKAAYKTFTKQATPLIKALGILSDPDDGGEIFADPDDGGEVFSSSKLITKSLGIFCPACSIICTGCPPNTKKL
jgi:hypothetical protein